MNSDDVSDDLRNWIEGLDTGQHYAESDVYRDLVFRQIMPSAREHKFDQPVLVPEGRFEELVCITHNYFGDLVSDGKDYRLQNLKEGLPRRLESLSGEIEELTTRIESLCKIMDQFRGLDSRFETLDGAAKEDEFPESILRHEASDGTGSQEFEAVYDASQLFNNEVKCLVYRGDRSPLCIALDARMPLKNLREERLTKRKAYAVGKLRLKILNYVLAHHQITGFPPEKLTLEDAEQEVEDARESAKKRDKSKGGRPPLVSQKWDGDDVDRDDINEIRDETLDYMLSCLAFHSLTDDGEVKTSWTDIMDSIEEGSKEGLFSSPDAIRQHVNRSDNIDLEEKKREVRGKLGD